MRARDKLVSVATTDLQVLRQRPDIGRRIAAAEGNPYLIPLKLPWPGALEGAPVANPDSTGGTLILYRPTDGPPAVIFSASTDRSNWRVGTLMAVFRGGGGIFSQLKFGYPNDEAQGDDALPVRCEGLALYEQKNSNWQAEIVAANRRRFPDTPDDLGLRHFVICFKEAVLEILAEDVQLFEVTLDRDEDVHRVYSKHVWANRRDEGGSP